MLERRWLWYCGQLNDVIVAHGVLLPPVDRHWIHGLKARRWPLKVIPRYRMDTEALFRTLIREYLSVSLFRAFADSLASMQVAERNIEDRLKALTSELHIISAFESLKEKKRPAAGGRTP